MLILNPHPTTLTAVTLLSYDTEAHQVIVKQLSSNGDEHPTVERIPLATFLRDIGVPFRAVRDITSEPVAA